MADIGRLEMTATAVLPLHTLTETGYMRLFVTVVLLAQLRNYYLLFCYHSSSCSTHGIYSNRTPTEEPLQESFSHSTTFKGRMEHTKLTDLIRQVSNKLNESFDNIDSMNQWKTQMFNFINEIAELKLTLSSSLVTKKNTSLDPVDWSSARCVTYNLLDSLLNFIQSVRDRPVWQPIPADVRITLESQLLPEQSQSLSDVCQYIFRYILPYSLGNTHPRFWGWVMGEGTLGGVLADMITATTNSNTGGRTQSFVLIERTVIKWMRQIFGFPEGNTSGLIVTGTSMATVISLATARQRVLSNVRKDGLMNEPRLVAYASTEVHICVPKALELLGLGSNALRRISVDENFSINIDELKTRIRVDQDNGLIPFCIIGSAGMSDRDLRKEIFIQILKK